ncbi:MAG: hypothetical protein WD055_02440 [Candidatus Dependentiae bacterium]
MDDLLAMLETMEAQGVEIYENPLFGRTDLDVVDRSKENGYVSSSQRVHIRDILLEISELVESLGEQDNLE